MKNIYITLLLLASILILNRCKKEDNPFAIGKSYQGGKIAYVLQPGDPGYDAKVPHGLIAAPSDQSEGIQWWNGSYISTGATATALGTGNANTNLIVASQGAGIYAAKLCYDLVLGGYSDWYLPSKVELNKLHLNRAAIGNLTYGFYWSSSETGWSGVLLVYMNAYYLDFFTGNISDAPKSVTTWHVRAIRSF